MIQSRFDLRIPFFVLIFLSVSYVLSIVLLQLLCAILFILWLTEKISEKKKAVDFFVMGVVFYGIIRLFSIIFSEYPDKSIHSLYKEALFYLSVFSFVYYLKVLSRKQIIIIIFTFLGGAAFNAIVGVTKFSLGLVDRAESFSSGYMTFSGYLLAALCISLISFDLNEIKKKKLYLNITTILIFAGIITSLGRANILVSVLMIITGLIFKKVNIKKVMIFAAAAVVISYMAFSFNTSLISQRIESPAALSDRDIIYKGAAEIFSEHPLLGYGPRTFKEIFPFKDQLKDKEIGSWHNQILQIYFESGFLGLTAYFILIFLIFKSGYGYLKNIRNEQSRSIVFGVMLSVAALFLSSFFSNFIDSPVLSIEFAFLVSLMTSEIFRGENVYK